MKTKQTKLLYIGCLLASILCGNVQADIGNTVQDAKITTAVKASILKAHYIDDRFDTHKIHVTTKDQQVFLSGCVQNPADRVTIHNLAETTQDVKEVIDHIEQNDHCDE